MATCEKLIDAIQEQIKTVTKIAPFKRTEFGGLGDNPSYPSLNFQLKNREPFDPPSIRPSGMQLRWELEYEVHVLVAGIQNTIHSNQARQHVDKAVEIFIDQMPSTERLNGLAFWLEPSNVQYGVIELETAARMKYIDGGLFTLTIQFIQDV